MAQGTQSGSVLSCSFSLSTAAMIACSSIGLRGILRIVAGRVDQLDVLVDDGQHLLIGFVSARLLCVQCGVNEIVELLAWHNLPRFGNNHVGIAILSQVNNESRSS